MDSMFAMLTLFMITVLLCLHDVESAPVEVSTAFGRIIGERVTSTHGFEVNAFRSIRYGAKPERFEESSLPAVSSDVQNATSWPTPCVQAPLFGRATVPQTEDCLFLSLFAPANPTEATDTGYPIMLFIHGGGFNQGFPERLGDAGIINNLVPKGVIVIAVQYRLGPFGFLSTGSDLIRGNWGLLDITLALKWVKINAKFFGGDPNKVTIFGQSAGAAAVGLLTISPVSQGLFHRAIQQSGAPQAPFAISPNPMNGAQRLIRNLNCAHADSKKVLACLKAANVEEVVNAAIAGQEDNVIIGHDFQPVIDGYFLPKPIIELYRTAPPKPLIIGDTSVEFGLFVNPVNNVRVKWTYPQMANFTLNVLDQVVNEAFPMAIYGIKANELRNAAVQFYLDGNQRDNLTFAYEKMTKLLSDVWITIPNYQHATARRKTGSAVYLYWFDYYNQNQFSSGHLMKGVYHGGEQIYLFDRQIFGTVTKNREDAYMLEMMTTLWTDFAKFGNPTPRGSPFPRWKSITKNDPSFFELNTTPKMSKGFGGDAIQFWTKTVPKLSNSGRA